MDDVAVLLKKKFSDRKLFSTGSIHLSKPSMFERIEDVLIEHDTDLISLWPPASPYMVWNGNALKTVWNLFNDTLL